MTDDRRAGLPGDPRRPVLVVGPAGMLGRAWVELLVETGTDHTTLKRPQIDLNDAAGLRRLDLSGIGVLVNCAAWTDVDAAEANEAQATSINGHALLALGQLARRARSLLVHYSTDYVFDGKGSSPYSTDHPVAPINAYGRSKALGERLLVESGCDFLLVRTSWLYAPWGRNFVLSIARSSRERDLLKVVGDQRGCPTSAEHLARTTLDLIRCGARGTFHVADGGDCTWYDLACAVVERVGAGCRVESTTTTELRRPAPRPTYSVLDLSRTEDLLGPAPAWRENLDRILQRAVL